MRSINSVFGDPIVLILNPQSFLSCSIRKVFQLAGIEVSVPVEDGLSHPFGLGALRNELADSFRSRTRRASLHIAQILLLRRSGNDRVAGDVVDNLGADMMQAPIDGQARPFGGTKNFLPDALLTPHAPLTFRAH